MTPPINDIAFYCVAALTILPAIMVVRSRNIFHGGLALAATFTGVAGLYLLLSAEFLAVSQMLIYTGAISVLLLFAIMMTQRVNNPAVPVFNRQRIAAVLVVGALTFIVFIALRATPWSIQPPDFSQNPLPQIGTLLLGPWVLPFELVSVVLLAALVGAVIIAKKEER